MDTLKVNISLPAGLYGQAKKLVQHGQYHSFSEMVRSGLRHELDEQREINPEFVKSIKKAEKSGYKKFASGRKLLADLHSAVD